MNRTVAYVQSKCYTAYQLLGVGGAWLGEARSWLQWHTFNGDRVTWGSNDVIQPSMTVKQVEDLAAHVAAAALNEQQGRHEREMAKLKSLCADISLWMHAAYDRPPQTPEALDILRRLDAMVGVVEPRENEHE